MYNNDLPPSTLSHLKDVPDSLLHRFKSGEPNLRFVKPSPGNGVEILHGESPLEHLRIVKLTLQSRGCIPFHRHKNKEKAYLVTRYHRTPFAAYLGIIDPVTGAMSVHALMLGSTHVVPKNHWHMIWVTSDETVPDYLSVVSSSQDGADVEWTPQGDLLIHLTEKANKDCQGETPLQLTFDELIKKIDEALEDD